MNNNIESSGQEVIPKKFPFQPKKMIPFAPTVLFVIAVIVLTIIPKAQTIKLQLQNDQFVFVTDFKPEVTFSPIKDIPVKGINLLNFKTVKIGYQKLFRVKNGKINLLAINGTAEIIPQLTDYDLRFSGNNIQISSLEIGGEALIGIQLENSAEPIKLVLEIQRYPSILRLQLDDSVFVMAKRCIVNYTAGGKIQQMQSTDHQNLIIIPSDVSEISPVTGTDNVFKFSIDITEKVFNSVFESEIPLKMLGFIESDITPEQDRVLKVKCKLLQIEDKQKSAYQDQIVFFKQQDLNQLRLEGMDLHLDDPGKINLNFSGYRENFEVGFHEDRIKNIMPSVLGWLSTSIWAISAAIFAWVITSSLLAFDLYYRRRSREEE